MEKSLFVKFAAFFVAITSDIIARYNDSKLPQVYLHTSMLTKELSTNLQWGSTNFDGSIISADVVSMDSALPLKKRDAIKTATGDIPKIGMKLYLSEKVMSDIDVLMARNADTKTIVSLVFADAAKATMGILEKIELMFLQGLSTGVALIEDENNVGTGIRVDYGYSADNSFGASVRWSLPDATPLDDIRRVTKAAKTKGDTINFLMMDDVTFTAFASNAQVKQSYGFSLGFVGTAIPTPNQEQVRAMLKANFKLGLIIVDRTVVTERDGVRTIHTPWAEGKVVFLTSDKVGKLVYGILAEDTRRNPAVMYAKPNEFILLKKWHTNDPFSEFTSSQALVVPVINNVGSIFILDTEEAESIEDQTEGNDTITIYDDSTVLRANLITALNDANVKSKPAANAEMTDVQLISLVNKLSDAKEAILKDILEIPTVSAGADTTANSATKALLGTATAAGDKTIASVQWTQVSGPNTAGFSAPTELSTNATGLVTGVYVFKLTATDSEGIIASDTIQVTATV